MTVKKLLEQSDMNIVFGLYCTYFNEADIMFNGLDIPRAYDSYTDATLNNYDMISYIYYTAATTKLKKSKKKKYNKKIFVTDFKTSAYDSFEKLFNVVAVNVEDLHNIKSIDEAFDIWCDPKTSKIPVIDFTSVSTVSLKKLLYYRVSDASIKELGVNMVAAAIISEMLRFSSDLGSLYNKEVEIEALLEETDISSASEDKGHSLEEVMTSIHEEIAKSIDKESDKIWIEINDFLKKNKELEALADKYSLAVIAENKAKLINQIKEEISY